MLFQTCSCRIVTANRRAMPESEVQYKTWMCLICGWIYDEAAGDPEHGIAPGTAWADIPDNWACPDCGVGKADFEMVEVA
mgnify:CR=1 FL=1